MKSIKNVKYEIFLIISWWSEIIFVDDGSIYMFTGWILLNKFLETDCPRPSIKVFSEPWRRLRLVLTFIPIISCAKWMWVIAPPPSTPEWDTRLSQVNSHRKAVPNFSWIVWDNVNKVPLRKKNQKPQTTSSDHIGAWASDLLVRGLTSIKNDPYGHATSLHKKLLPYAAK